MTDLYDFEFQRVPPAVCNRCGALVQNREVHNEWHDAVVTGEQLIDAIGRARRSREP